MDAVNHECSHKENQLKIEQVTKFRQLLFSLKPQNVLKDQFSVCCVYTLSTCLKEASLGTVPKCLHFNEVIPKAQLILCWS